MSSKSSLGRTSTGTAKEPASSSAKCTSASQKSGGDSPSSDEGGHDYPETTSQNLLLADTYSEDELGRWMEEQQQHNDDSSFILDGDGASSRQATTSKSLSKRSADGLQSESDSRTTTSKRRSVVSSHTPNSDRRSAARERMDKALHERHLCQMALRDSLLALREAEALVQACRRKYDAAKCNAETVAKNECEDLLAIPSSWNDMYHKLKSYKERTGHCNVKQNFAAKTCPERETAKLSAWVGRCRKDGKQRKRVEPSVEDASSSTTAISDKHEENVSVFEELESDSIHADPYKLIALDMIGFDWDPRNSRWMSAYEDLKKFKQVNGNTLVPHANCGLGSWVKRQQVQYTLYKKGDGTKSELTEERVRLLNDLGFVWSRRSNTWNENFQRLSKWKEEHGNIHIPDDSDDPDLVALNKWIADQRAFYKRQVEDEGDDTDDATALPSMAEANSSNDRGSKKKGKRKVPRLSAEKIAQLKGIGFEFDSRDAKWLQRVDELLKYKQDHGDCLVPSHYPDNPTLSNWVASQRAQYKLYIKKSKTNLTERRLQILKDAGFSFSGVRDGRQKEKKDTYTSQQDRAAFDAKPWLEKCNPIDEAGVKTKNDNLD